MPRKAHGTTFVSDGAAYASVTVAPRKRLARSLHGIVDVPDDNGARAWAATLQELVDALRAAGRGAEIADKVDLALQVGRNDLAHGIEQVRAGVAKLRASHADASIAAMRPTTKGATTFEKFAKRWTSGELHTDYPDHVAEKKTADDDVSRLKKYVYRVIGHVPLSELTIEHAQDVLRRIPKTVTLKKTDAKGRRIVRETSRSTRRHVAQLMVRILNLAVYPAKLIKVSPLPRGFLPKVGPKKAQAYLYPDEDRTLLACTAVPLANRILYGVLAREGMRSVSEALALTWSDVDLQHGGITLDENKTDDPRAWTLDPGVVAALTWWRKRVPHKDRDPLFPGLTDPGHLAGDLRTHLQIAGVARPELYENSKARKNITAHALRSTFITVNLANGKSSDWIADRTGHRSTGQIANYKRPARMVAELGLGPLSPLDAAIPEMRSAREAQGTVAIQARPARRGSGRSHVKKETIVHGRGLEPPCLAAAEPKARSTDAGGSACRDHLEIVTASGARRAPESTEPCASLRNVDAVEAALVRALDAATVAGRFDVVAQLAKEIEARRLDRTARAS